MSTRDYYRDHYCLEVTRRGELTNGLSLPLGILSLLIAGLVVVAQAIRLPLDGLATAQLVVMCVALAFVLLTAYFLARSYYNYGYGYTPTAQEIKKYKEDLAAYYVAIGDSEAAARSKAEDEALDHLDSEYAQHAHRNRINNNTKSSYLHKANGALIAAVVSTLAAGAIFLVSSFTAVRDVPEVRVVNLSEMTMTNPSNTSGQTQQQTNTQSPTVPAPVKPSPPPGQVLKEHVNPAKKP